MMGSSFRRGQSKIRQTKHQGPNPPDDRPKRGQKAAGMQQRCRWRAAASGGLDKARTRLGTRLGMRMLW
eukprot:4013670-Pleurochrysis_carterae.AAC.1